MPIDVICPGCHKRFSVSDEFAGKKGPCPACQTVIEIPKLEDVVVIHERETTASGAPAKLDSIRRKSTTAGKFELGLGIGALIAALVLTVLGRMQLTEVDPNPAFLIKLFAGGLLGISSSVLGHIVLRGQDHGSVYSRKTIFISSVVGLAYTVIWRLQVLISDGVLVQDGSIILPAVVILAIAFTVITTFLPMFVFEFEYQEGLTHVALFICSLTVYSLILGDIAFIIK